MTETLEALFDRWQVILKTHPTEAERAQLKSIQLYTLADADYLEKRNDPAYFQRWRDQLPGYYQGKVDLMLEILTRLKADRPMEWIVSEIHEDIPQLAYFLLVRHLELFVLNDPLRLKQLQPHQPKWLWQLLQKGVTLEEIDALAQQVAHDVLGNFLAVTDGYGQYGDLPFNAPRPRIAETNLETGDRPRYLDGIHEYIEDSVLQAPDDE